MKLSNEKIKSLTQYQPEIVITLLYVMALSDENDGVELGTDLMCDVLNRTTAENNDYLDKLINAGLIKRTFKAKNGDIINNNPV